MARTYGVDSIEAAFHEIFEEYGREVDESLKGDLQYAGEFAANEVSRLSPVGDGHYYGRKRNADYTYTKVRKSGKHYGKGWDYSFEKDPYGGMSVIVHNKTKPSLTHLLERGHMDRAGGWVGPKNATGDGEHIEPAFERATELLERRLRNG